MGLIRKGLAEVRETVEKFLKKKLQATISQLLSRWYAGRKLPFAA